MALKKQTKPKNKTAAEANEDSMGRREAGKLERKRRIIEAARELIRETGNAGLSMRALAERAGVSLATPYNLFGSKQAIVLAVLEDIREYDAKFASLRTADPIDRIFAAGELALRFYKNDPEFYKTLWAAVSDASGGLRALILSPQRYAFWQHLVGAAAEAGAIDKDIDVVLLVRQLDRILCGVMLDWSIGDVTSRQLQPTVFLGYALMLKAVATPAWQPGLEKRIAESQAKLLGRRPKA